MGTKKAEPNVKVLSLSTLSYLPLTAHPPQSGFYPTIPLNSSSQDCQQPLAAKASGQFSVHFLPSWQHLTTVFIPSFLKTCPP